MQSSVVTQPLTSITHFVSGKRKKNEVYIMAIRGLVPLTTKDVLCVYSLNATAFGIFFTFYSSSVVCFLAHAKTFY